MTFVSDHARTYTPAPASKADAHVQAANYVLAPLILVVFVIVVSFVLLNMVSCALLFNVFFPVDVVFSLWP